MKRLVSMVAFLAVVCSAMTLSAAEKRPEVLAVILKVNEPGTISLAISVGSDDGVKAGDVFAVYRGKKDLGKVKITKVTPGQSAAKITKLEEGQKLQRGDFAIRRR